MSVEDWISAFSAAGCMLSGPAALPDFSDLMALVISILVGGSVMMAMSLAYGDTGSQDSSACIASCVISSTTP